MAKQSTSVTLRRTAGEVKRYRRYKKLIPLLITIFLLIIIMAYVISVLYMKIGAFTVMVNKFDHLDYALSLSENANFNSAYSRLNADIYEEITNIDGRNLPDYLDNVDGEHNGDNYIAYTFYCKNVGRATFAYTYDMYIANMSLECEKAARIRLYVNGEYTDYAYPRTDGIEGPEPGTVAFASRTTVVKNRIDNFAPGDITKFTVVIWLEGNDPECVDRILGGQLKVDMLLDVVKEEYENNPIQ